MTDCKCFTYHSSTTPTSIYLLHTLALFFVFVEVRLCVLCVVLSEFVSYC